MDGEEGGERFLFNGEENDLGLEDIVESSGRSSLSGTIDVDRRGPPKLLRRSITTEGAILLKPLDELGDGVASLLRDMNEVS